MGFRIPLGLIMKMKCKPLLFLKSLMKGNNSTSPWMIRPIKLRKFKKLEHTGILKYLISLLTTDK